jgi:ABC-type cobalamin/Fe3+-siderophores transport system ATPase subunit
LGGFSKAMSNFVLAITGPSGAGKSTIGEKLAKQLERCVNIDADHIKHMIVNGFYYDRVNPQDEKKWGFSEWALVGESIGLLAQNFLKHGYDVVINGYIDAPAWEELQKLVTITHKVLLLPNVNTAKVRDLSRREDVRQGAAAVERHHVHFSTDNFFKDFITIDTTNHSVGETIKEVREVLA